MTKEAEGNFGGVNYYVTIPEKVLHNNSLTPLARLIFGELSALANINGYCWISNRKLAEKYGVSLSAITKSIGALKDFEYIRTEVIYRENSKEIEKRHIFINWGIVNNYGTLLEKNTGGYGNNLLGGIVKNYSVNNTVNNTTNNTNNNNNSLISKADKTANSYEIEFGTLWKKYPSKTGKDKALKSYKVNRKSGVSYETISEKLDEYLAYLEINKSWLRAKNGSTWFNSKPWLDEPLDMTAPSGNSWGKAPKAVKAPPAWSSADEYVENTPVADQVKFAEWQENMRAER